MSNKKAIAGDGRTDFDPAHLFATDEEQSNRLNDGYEPGMVPHHRPTEFKQITPSIAADNLNSPKMRERSGGIKFGGTP